MNSSPAHLNLVYAYSRLLIEFGFHVISIVPETLCNLMDRPLPSGCTLSTSHSETIYAELAIILSPSVENLRFLKNLKRANPELKSVYLLHEPWESFFTYFKTEGSYRTFRNIVSYLLVSEPMIQLVDSIIVPSQYALEIVKKSRAALLNKTFVIPLLFEDEAGDLPSLQKHFFSYIGHAVKGHYFDLFIKLVEFYQINTIQVEPLLRFQITTRTDLRKLVLKRPLLRKALENKILEVNHGKPLTIKEINKAYATSFAIWNVYRRTTQSGVLPKAFMFGVPVLATPIGSFLEYVKNGETGFILDDLRPENILGKILEVRDNLAQFEANCRAKFLTTFYWKAALRKFENVLSFLF